MGHETELFGIRKLSNQIESERVKLIGDTPSKHSAAYDALEQKITDWERRFVDLKHTWERTLKSRSHFNHMMYQTQRFGANAYSERQRLQSREANVAEVSKAVVELERRLRDLLYAFTSGNGSKTALDAIAGVIENHMKTSHQPDALARIPTMPLQNAIAEIRADTGQHPAAGGAPVFPVVDIFTLILAYFALLKKLSKKP